MSQKSFELLYWGLIKLLQSHSSHKDFLFWRSRFAKQQSDFLKSQKYSSLLCLPSLRFQKQRICFMTCVRSHICGIRNLPPPVPTNKAAYNLTREHLHRWVAIPRTWELDGHSLSTSGLEPRSWHDGCWQQQLGTRSLEEWAKGKCYQTQTSGVAIVNGVLSLAKLPHFSKCLPLPLSNLAHHPYGKAFFTWCS